MENKQVSLLQKLDGVLIYLERQKQPPIKTIGEITTDLATALNTDQSELLLLLEKLIDDKYVSRDDQKITRYGVHTSAEEVTKYYIITFNGRFFISYSGYVKQEAANQSEKNRLDAAATYQREQADTLNRLTHLVAWGTVAASVIAFLLLLWEIRHAILRLWHQFF